MKVPHSVFDTKKISFIITETNKVGDVSNMGKDGNRWK